MHTSSATTAVVLYTSSTTDWGMINSYLHSLPVSTSVFITSSKPIEESTKRLLETFQLNIQFKNDINYQSAIAALVGLLKYFALYEFDLVLLISSANIRFSTNQEKSYWLKEQFQQLIPIGRLNLIFDFFAHNPSLGIAGPHQSFWPIQKFFFDEKAIAHWNTLTKDRTPNDFPADPHFFAGGMFWARGSIFKGLANLNFDPAFFENDIDAFDDSFSQALERFFPLIAHDQGLTVSSFDFADFTSWLSRRNISDSHQLAFTHFLSSSPSTPKLRILIRSTIETTAEELQASKKSIHDAQIIGWSIDSFELRNEDLLTDAAAVNLQIQHNEFEWLMLINAGDILTRNGLQIATLEISQQSEMKAFFTDKLIRSATGSLETAFLPDFDFDLLSSFPWLMSNHWLFQRECLLNLDCFDTALENYYELDFIFRLHKKFGPQVIKHIAEPILIAKEPDAYSSELKELAVIEKNIRRHGFEYGDVLELSPRLYRVNYGFTETPLVSIIIVNEFLNSTQKCLESLLSFTSYPNYEILIVDNKAHDFSSQAWLSGLNEIDPKRFKVIYAPSGSSNSQLINLGASTAVGNYILCLTCSVRFVEKTWLDSLLNQAQRPSVGAVGPKIIDTNGGIFNAGYILGSQGISQSPFVGEPFNSNGYLQRLNVEQCYSAVSCDCVLLRRDTFLNAGGFKEHLNSKNARDLDFCLEISALGLNNIWTPHAIVQFDNSDEFNNQALGKDSAANIDAEADYCYKKWLPIIATDASYNKNLSLNGPPFTVESANDLTWQPLSWRPNPVIVVHPADETGSGQYRVIQPMSGLRKSGFVDGVISDRQLLPAEIERLQPDSVILQRQTSDSFLEYARRIKAYSNAFKVYEIDDLLHNMPLKSNVKSAPSKALTKNLREGIALADRLVVSTPGLAEAFDSWKTDIKVLELKLPIAWWTNLHFQEKNNSKPRIGWAGGSTHTGDLELIADIVKDLAQDIDWIFFGMCPQKLRPYIKEYHSGVPIHMYPQKLASLGLDLALAPLENSQFNDCKSNLRLLEYGACGLPVICSNTRAYVESKLPVHIVKNRYKDWMEAIRAHIADLNYCKARGSQLQLEVQSSWMLNDSELAHWKNAWLP